MIRASEQKPLTFGLVALTSLFFAWGFLTSLNDILVPHLRAVFSLSYTEGALVQSAFFLAYFFSSLPSAAIVARVGYKRGLTVGLLAMAAGAALFVPAARFESFPMFLGALFILASGITLLQVSANPYVTLLGPSASASARLNLTQAFNSLGTTIAPVIGGIFLAASGALATTVAAQASAVSGPYAAIAGALVLLAIAFYVMPMPEPKEVPERLSWHAIRAGLASPKLSRGVVGIFVYVGAEVTIGSFLINFILSTSTLATDAAGASKFVALYWGGAMVGRFIGAWLMRFVSPSKLLAGCGLGAAVLVALSLATTGAPSVYALLAVGLCNSIMFPTIFSLGVQRLGPLTGVGSSLMIVAIVGGAIIPLVSGALADTVGLKAVFALPLLCYLYIANFGRFSAADAVGETVAARTIAVPMTDSAL